MKTVLFELCTESLESAQAAQTGGADRIELCTSLAVGGITPPVALMTPAIRILDIPVHVLIRSRAGNFVFSSDEFDLMCRQIEAARHAGATGIATGILLANGRVDVHRTRALVDLARPMGVTFHRAFDETADLPQALEDVIQTGADSLLTSGGASDLLAGSAMIRSLAGQAGNRIQLITGGGLKLDTLEEVLRRTGVFHLHGSLTRLNGEIKSAASADEVRKAVRLLRHGFAELAPPPVVR